MTASFGGQFRGGGGAGGIPGFGQGSGPSGFGAMFSGGMGSSITSGGMQPGWTTQGGSQAGGDKPWYLDENWLNLIKLITSITGGVAGGIAGPQARQASLWEEQEERSKSHAADIGRVFGAADWKNRRFGSGGVQTPSPSPTRQRHQGGGTNYTGRP